MMNWDDARFWPLRAAARYAKAASQLHVDQATVGRRLSAFEDALGSKLFIRTPKSFALSPLGRKCWRT